MTQTLHGAAIVTAIYADQLTPSQPPLASSAVLWHSHGSCLRDLHLWAGYLYVICHTNLETSPGLGKHHLEERRYRYHLPKGTQIPVGGRVGSVA